MNWITGIQRAIDYVEDNLTECIDMREVAKRAYSSPFHFQRVFSILCGYTLGDYIRMRRLSLAGSELCSSDKKVIDIALKYGYETPESFSRAFSRFHGITPQQAKNGGNIRSFSRISVKFILDGGNIMNYRIEKKDRFNIICKTKRVTKPESETATADISEFWADCSNDGTVKKIIECIPENPSLKGLLGVCFSGDIENNAFPYAIGVEYDGKNVPDGLEVVEIPAHTYAVFTCKGKMPDAFVDTYRKICTEFFPQSDKYEYASGVELEVYPSDKTDDPDYTCEIWIAVNEK